MKYKKKRTKGNEQKNERECVCAKNRRDSLQFLTYSIVRDMNICMKGERRARKEKTNEKLLSIVRNKDHCEHNAIEEKKINSMTIN